MAVLGGWADRPQVNQVLLAFICPGCPGLWFDVWLQDDGFMAVRVGG